MFLVQQKKATYYPETTLTITQTPFGMIETSPSTLYQQPIPGKIIVQIDLLVLLTDTFGEASTADRERLYMVVSGKTDAPKDWCDLMAHFYRRYATFANFIDFIFYFGDESVSLYNRIKYKLQETIERARDYVRSLGGKILMEDHGYVYVAFSAEKAKTLNVEGVLNVYV